MNPSMKKIALLFLAIIVVPLLVFSIYEIGGLKQNENVIQGIYRNQLDAILYSVNQYSEDVMSSWARKIESRMQGKQGDYNPDLKNLLTEMPAVQMLLQFDNKINLTSSYSDSESDRKLIEKITQTVVANDTTVEKLRRYMGAGYRKIQGIYTDDLHYELVMFMTQSEKQSILNVLVIDPGRFIGEVLDPKIQEIAKEKFFITAYQAGEAEHIYTSDKQHTPGKITEKKPFWLLENFLMGIELKDRTITDLAHDRVKKDLLLIVLTDIVLLFGALLIFRNVRKQVELSQLKSDFVSNVSHEIRTPLALISMYIETLEMGRVKSKEKVREYYSVILNETQRLSGIVNKILNFSQIENKKRRYVFSETNINEVVEITSQTYRFNLEKNGFTFNTYPALNLPFISADKEALSDALVNLIDNAMKYSADRKEITVRTGTDNGYVFMEVEDQGLGIAEKDQKYIFDKFYRVTEKNLAHKAKGSGLGLAIVKHIMDAHKGKIIVKSKLNEGSKFMLLFPTV